MNLARSALVAQVDDRSRFLKGFFIIQLIGVIVLQKLAVPAGGAYLELCLPLLGAGLFVVLARGGLSIDPIRLIAFALFLLSCLVSQLLGGTSLSGPAFLLMIALYASMVFQIDVPEVTYLRCLNAFQTAMLLVTGIVVLQHIVQIAASWTLWPNLDKLLPQQFLLPGYNYLQPLKYASRFYKPHGIFFLETSLVSQFAALAAIIELVYFRRITHIAGYVALLLMLFAGTGLLVLGLTAPFLLLRLPRRALVWLAIGGFLAAVVAVASGWFAQIQDRIFEFQHPGTSGYYRFTVPFLTMMDRASDPSSLIMGYGAGNTPTKDASILLPPVKVAFEYGFIPMFLFFLFFIISMFKSAPNVGIAIGFLMFYLFGGGSFAVPVYIVMCVLFCTLLRVRKCSDAVTFPIRGETPSLVLAERTVQ